MRLCHVKRVHEYATKISSVIFHIQNIYVYYHNIFILQFTEQILIKKLEPFSQSSIVVI